MIYTYGFSLTGSSHTENGIECQDAHKITELENGWVIAAVADGVGSAKNSAIGARIAVETSVSFCEEYMPCDYNTINIKSMLRTAFNYAFKRISLEAKLQGNEIESYDTTLTLVIYNGYKIIYGHSGDGGIIGLNSRGDYITITKQLKSEDHIAVIPLRAGYTSWVIDSYEEELSAVLLATDGMYELLTPYLLRHRNPRVYVPLGMFFMDTHCFSYAEESREGIDGLHLDFLEGRLDQNRFYDLLRKTVMTYLDNEEDTLEIISSIRDKDYPIKLMANVTDDKTIVGLIHCEKLPEAKPKEYYREPDWTYLKNEWNKLAYPNLFREKVEPEIMKKERVPVELQRVIRTEKILQKEEMAAETTANPVDLKPSLLERFMGTYYGPGEDMNIIDLPMKHFTENMVKILQQIKHNSLNNDLGSKETGNK